MSHSALAKLGDLGEFLTDQSKALAQNESFDYKAEERAFRETFAVLATQLGDDAFRRYDSQRRRFVGGFSVSAFEAVAIGVGYSWKKAEKNAAEIPSKVMHMWSDGQFVENSGSGIRASSRVPKIIPYGRAKFGK
jgi:hypothetical protein